MSWFSAIFRKRTLERELDKELRFHLEEHIDALIKAGRTPTEARREAMLEFGGLEQFKEACRDERGGQWLETVGQDLRYAVRRLRNEKGFTTTVLLTLALGIGAFTTIFSVVNGLMLNPRDYPQLDRLVMLREKVPPLLVPLETSGPNFIDWRMQAKSFEGGLVGLTIGGFNITGIGEPLQVKGGHVSANFFDVLGVKLHLGRGFLPGEDEPCKGRVLILSFPFWHRHFNGSPDVIGRGVEVDGQPYTIVGVAPEWLSRTEDARPLWTPEPSVIMKARKTRLTDVWGRLKPGVTLAQAQAEMDVIAAQLAAQYPENAGTSVSVIPRLAHINRQWSEWLWTLLAAVGCLLLIACVNVANLLLARATARQREIALRATLGAGRWRLIRQLLTESLLLAVLGGGAGLLLAMWGVDGLRSLAPVVGVERMAYVELDGGMLIFALGLSLLTGVVFGLAPAWLAARVDLRESLNQGARGTTEGGVQGRLRGLLVVSEVSLALVLLAGAGLFVRSFIRLSQADLGFVPEHATTFMTDLKGVKKTSVEPRIAFLEAVLHRLREIPGVSAAGASSPLYVLGWPSKRRIPLVIEGAPPVDDATAAPHMSRESVTPGFFAAMGIPLLRGRMFTEQDNTATSPRVTLINATLARQFFPHENPIGRRINHAEIVGVVTDAATEAPDQPGIPQTYIPYAHAPHSTPAFVVRTARESAALPAAIRAAVYAVDPDQPLIQIRRLEDTVSDANALRRFAMGLLGLFSAVALVLAAVGLYGVIAYSVHQRTTEIGIRVALGAEKSDILRLILRQGAKLVGIGLALGLVIALGAGRLIESRLYQTSSRDPLTLVSICLFFAVVAALACWVPARRAAKLDPMVALRAE
jgi:putative ABC transport system permease protein